MVSVRILVLGLLLGAVPYVDAADVERGRAKAVACVACHGAEGVSPNELWPNLAGQQAAYLRKQLLAYREGTRVDPMMSPMAKPLTDEEIDDLAAYYNSLK